MIEKFTGALTLPCEILTALEQPQQRNPTPVLVEQRQLRLRHHIQHKSQQPKNENSARYTLNEPSQGVAPTNMVVNAAAMGRNRNNNLL